MKLFVDMDGVLADFDRQYIETIGPLPDRADPARDVNWSKIGDMDFFASMPPMADAFELWDHASALRGGAVILTGCPNIGRERAEHDKRDWVRRHLGAEVEVRTLLSKEKSLHCSPGDILIDDWEKYRQLWEVKGGLWITHTSAKDTIDQLRRLAHEI
jgi:hypothetical protein